MENQPIQHQATMPNQQTNISQPVQTQGQEHMGMFQRRMGRQAFFLGHLYWLAIASVPILLQLFFYGSTSPRILILIVNIALLLSGMILLVLFIPGVISMYVRRIHDANQSGWLTILACMPPVLLYILLVPGTKGPNKYGEPVNSNKFLVILGFKKPA